MSFLDRIFQRSAKPAEKRAAGESELLKFLPGSASGVSVTADSAMGVTSVYRAVSLIAQTYASIPLGVYRLRPDGGKELDRKHSLFNVLCKEPNERQTSFEWREMMSLHFALYGRCYSEIISSGNSAVAQLIPLHPDTVQPFIAPNGKMAFAYSSQSGARRVILREDMHFMHGLILDRDGITPLAPVKKCAEAIGLAIATEEHGARLFANGTRLGGILKMPGHLRDDTARKSLIKSWREAFSGVKNTGKTALLEDGMEWQALGMTNEDAQFLESRKMQNAEISRIFGVPLHMLAELDRSTNNNIEHQGMEFVTHTIRPGAIRREEAMERDLLTGKSKDTHCIYFDLDGLMRGDSAARANFNSSMLQNGVMTRNEIRINEGLNPVSNEGMDEFTVQLNLTTTDKIGQPVDTTKEVQANE